MLVSASLFRKVQLGSVAVGKKELLVLVNIVPLAANSASAKKMTHLLFFYHFNIAAI